jgi:hypothetical protein
MNKGKANRRQTRFNHYTCAIQREIERRDKSNDAAKSRFKPLGSAA